MTEKAPLKYLTRRLAGGNATGGLVFAGGLVIALVTCELLASGIHASAARPFGAPEPALHSLILTGADSTAPQADPGTATDPKEPLSEKLHKDEGVITPPKGVDPEIKKPMPKDFESDMPVIAPPGEPGGDQGVQPK